MSNRERQALITEIIDYHSDPESFPRMQAQVDTYEILEYIDKCEDRARQDERRRVQEALLSDEQKAHLWSRYDAMEFDVEMTINDYTQFLLEHLIGPRRDDTP